jgi:hypothetical protein
MKKRVLYKSLILLVMFLVAEYIVAQPERYACQNMSDPPYFCFGFFSCWSDPLPVGGCVAYCQQYDHWFYYQCPFIIKQ